MKKSVILLFFMVFCLTLADTFADRRYFGRSYLPYTLPAGALELEIWNTGRIGKASGYYYRFQPRFELEYGVTDRLSASMYFNFNQVKSENNSFQSSPFGFSSTSLELRYQLTDPGQVFVDPGLYFEFGYGGDEIEYESKLLLAKRFGNLITVLNLNSEIEREVVENKSESVFELTGGIMYELIQSVALGVEFRNHRSFEDVYKQQEAQATFIGPSINIQTSSFFLTFNFLAQVAGSPSNSGSLDLAHHEKYEFRTIVGVDL